MAWVKIDDMFARHPKAMRVGPLGMALHVAGLCYCSQYLTDGFIPNAVTNTLLDWSGIAFMSVRQRGETAHFDSGADVETWMVVDLLVGAGLWEERDGGFQIHDYLVYNPSRGQVIAQREANAARQQRHKARQNHAVNNDDDNATSNGVTNAAPVPDPLPKRLTPPTPSKRETYSEEFLAFYEAYPKHENKRAAFDYWDKTLKPDPALIETIMAAVERQKTGRKWIEGFANAPDVWLRGAKWEDEPEAVRPSLIRPTQADHNRGGTGRVVL